MSEIWIPGSSGDCDEVGVSFKRVSSSCLKQLLLFHFEMPNLRQHSTLVLIDGKLFLKAYTWLRRDRKILNLKKDL